MASNIRVQLVTCVTFCLFSSIVQAVGGLDGVDVRRRNGAENFEVDRRGGQRDFGGAQGMMMQGQGGGGAPAPGMPANVPGGGGLPAGGPNFQQQDHQRLAINAAQQNIQNVKPQYLQQQQQQGLGFGNKQVDQQRWRGDTQQQQNFNPLPQQQAWQQQKLKPLQPSSNRPIRIAEHPACREDVINLCGKNARGNNFSVLDCLQNAGEDGGELSDLCNQFLWSYKLNLTTDVRFDSAAFEVCKNEIKKFPTCTSIEKGQTELLPCLYEVVENITTVQCRQYVNRMKAITFSDYRLLKGFYDKCKEDIEKKQCGVVSEKGLPKREDFVLHKQGATINCLEKHIEELKESCQLQIMRVAELTADDYHSDRALYFACRDDRERFCESEAAGQGAIYSCLLKHKFKEDMSEDCRNKLSTRQIVISHDYKANYRLMRKCREDIKKTNCNKPKDSQGREFRLSKLLICLEKAKHKGEVKLSGDCVAELEETRKSLMGDFMINPEIMTGCKKEINQQCSGLQRGGITLQCLMKLGQEKKLNLRCEAALQNLVKTADAGANYHIDRALHKACKPVREKLCQAEEVGDAKVLSCLMENIYSTDMTKECETELLLLQYFVARDFQLDPLLFKNCKADVNNLCNDEDIENSELPQGLVFACLNRHLHPDSPDEQLSAGCQAQVHRVLRQRAISVHLNPQIEAYCRADLGKLCADKTGKGEELSCLQANYKELSEECKAKIRVFTVEEAEDVKMNRKLMAACAPMIKQFCKDFLTKKVDEGAALQCLIDHKNDDEMNEKCAAGIEHFQLIQLQDYRFSYKFKDSCRKDVIEFCKTSKDKNSIIKCLSSKVRDDTLNDRQHNVSEECRKQLKAELLQRSEDIKLDPDLFRGCEQDVKKYCSKLKAGKARILECLRDHRNNLNDTCHVKLFNRQKEQAVNPKTDYAFIHSCQQMIKQFCSGIPQDTLFKCLKSHKNEPSFDPTCKAVLTKRGIQKKEDFRLNPALQKACRRDMPKFCSDVIEKSKQEKQRNKVMEGEMLQCLKKKFVSKHLSPDCENYVRDAIQEASMDFRMDPILSRICKETAKKLCSEELETPGQGQVEECLKTKLQQGKIIDVMCRMQVIRLLQEGRADVHIDPLLYKACALDIKHFCAGIPQGEGRQMSCLLEANDDSTIKLHTDCQRMISERREMWSYAIKLAPPGSFQDLAAAINASDERGYFLTVLLIMIAVLFFGGLCCGRATKRVRAEFKNK